MAVRCASVLWVAALALACSGARAEDTKEPIPAGDPLPTIPVTGHWENHDRHIDAHAVFGFTWGFNRNPGDTEHVRDAGQGDGPCDGKGDPSAGTSLKRGNPVAVATGNKVEPEVDFASTGEMPLTLGRTYDYYWDYRGLFGKFWVSDFDYTLAWTPDEAQIYAQRPDGRRILFERVGTTGRWVEDKASPVAYILKNADGTYTHYNESRGTETYNVAGRPITIRSQQGIGWTFAYGAGDLANYPIQVTHTSGRRILFNWTISAKAGGATGGYLSSVTAPDDSVFAYDYDFNAFGTGLHRLKSVTAPVAAGNASTRIDYLYEKAGKPGALTGKSFQGVRYSTFDYDADGRTVLTQHHLGASVVDRYAFAYAGTVAPPTNLPPQPPGPGLPCQPSGQGHCGFPRPAPETDPVLAQNRAIAEAEDAAISTLLANTTVTETNPLGRTTTYTVDPSHRVTNVSEAVSSNCPARLSSRAYDAATGYPRLAKDFNGNQATYQYDTAGRLSQQTESYLSSIPRTTTYAWDAQYNQMTDVTVAGDHATTYAYNADRRLQSITVKNLSANGTANQTHAWFYTYAKYASGIVQTMTVDGPLAQDKITYSYSAAGDLTSMTNELGQTTTYSGYNGLGQVGRVTGPNGDATDYAYYPGGALKSVTTYPNGSTASTTTLTYAAGLLATSQAPDGMTTTYAYDQARRLTNLSRPEVGGTAERRYFYNAASSVIREEVYRGATLRYRAYTDYDELGRVIVRRGNNGENMRYAYDANGNVRTITDSLNRVTTLTYDALNRVATSTDAKYGLTRFQYDTGDRLTSIIDPRGLSTTYKFDGFGQLYEEKSPDRGTTSYAWNASGLRTSMTRANYAATTYGYDGLGRLTSIAASPVTEVYGYDGCINGKGRVCNADLSGGTTPSSVQYQYEPDGRVRVRRELPTVGGVQTDFWTTYGYDAIGRLTSLTYPNGEVAGYGYTSGRPGSLTIRIGGTTSNVVSGVSYEPMGPPTGWTYGNGLTLVRSFDVDRRLTGQSTKNGATALQSLSYGYNANDLITGISNAVDGSQSRSYGYDELSRLNGYVYDANGNRTSGSDGTTYTIAANSNRLSGTNVIVAGSTFTQDALGNTIAYALPGFGSVSYGYDPLNRMSSVALNGTSVGAYGYNAYGERSSKTASGVRTRYVYTDDHGLIAEKPDTGVWTNYLWFNGELVGLTRGGV